MTIFLHFDHHQHLTTLTRRNAVLIINRQYQGLLLLLLRFSLACFFSAQQVLLEKTMINYNAVVCSLEIIPKFTGVISMTASTLLARHIITKKKWGDISLTNKILFCISIVDIISSFFVDFLSSWMAPRETPNSSFAAGTTGTCSAQGFISVFSLVYFATSYTALAVLYWLVVNRGWTKNQMEQRRIRFSFLLPQLVVALCAALSPLFFGAYNYGFILQKCFLNYYPEDCYEENKECTRGSVVGVNIAQNIIFGYMLLGNIIVVLFMGLLICSVYRQEKKADRYLLKGQERNRKNTYSTAWQGVRFSAAYLVPYMMFYVFFFYDLLHPDGTQISEPGALVVLYYVVIMMPLLGVFNASVYFYPRYATQRQKNSEKSRMACLCDVLGIGCKRKRHETVEEDTNSTPLVSDEDIQTLL